MIKNNIGEAIFISSLLFIIFYFKPEPILNILLWIFMLIPIMTWSYTSSKIRDKTNELSWKKTELEIKKLEKELNE